MKIYMAIDPETRRVLVQDREFADGDFPPGLRGLDWPRRTLDVPKQTVTKLRRGTTDGEQADRLHRVWWDKARGPKDPAWPFLSPDEEKQTGSG